MAIHDNLKSMSVEAIDEYLALVEYGVTTKKANGGLYGYPSVLLLFCVVDALSNFEGHPKNTLRGLQSMFPELDDSKMKSLKNWYRNLLSHQAIIMPGTQLSAEPSGAPIEWGANGEPVLIRIIPLFIVVKRAWDAFDKNKVNPIVDQHQLPHVTASQNLSEAPGVSGCYVTTAKY